MGKLIFKDYDVPNNTVTKGKLVTFDVNLNTYEDNRGRTIRVWLPTGYKKNDKSLRYPVLYMVDGQNLFDKETCPFKKEWCIDEHLTNLSKKGIVEKMIVVGIDNSYDRHNEFCPPFLMTDMAKQNFEERNSIHVELNPTGDKMGEYIVNTLKPLIDENFNTKPEKENTAIGGSSLGGIYAYYLAVKYPQVFSKCLSYSPAFLLYEKDDIRKKLDELNFDKNSTPYGRFAFYVGGTDFESAFIDTTFFVYNYMKEKGFDENNLSLVHDSKQWHNEEAWSQYFEDGITFLFKK